MKQFPHVRLRGRRLGGGWAATAAAEGLQPQFLRLGKNPYASIFGELLKISVHVYLYFFSCTIYSFYQPQLAVATSEVAISKSLEEQCPDTIC